MFIYIPRSIGMRGRQGKVSKLVLGESSKGEILRGVSRENTQNSPRKDWFIRLPLGEVWPCYLPQVANHSHSRRADGRLTPEELIGRISSPWGPRSETREAVNN